MPSFSNEKNFVTCTYANGRWLHFLLLITYAYLISFLKEKQHSSKDPARKLRKPNLNILIEVIEVSQFNIHISGPFYHSVNTDWHFNILYKAITCNHTLSHQKFQKRSLVKCYISYATNEQFSGRKMEVSLRTEKSRPSGSHLKQVQSCFPFFLQMIL